MMTIAKYVQAQQTIAEAKAHARYIYAAIIAEEAKNPLNDDQSDIAKEMFDLYYRSWGEMVFQSGDKCSITFRNDTVTISMHGDRYSRGDYYLDDNFSISKSMFDNPTPEKIKEYVGLRLAKINEVYQQGEADRAEEAARESARRLEQDRADYERLKQQFGEK